MSNPLRKRGPIGAKGSEAEGGVRACDAPINNATAKPHPDHCEPENDFSQKMHGAPPKSDLGHMGQSGAK